MRGAIRTGVLGAGLAVALAAAVGAEEPRLSIERLYSLPRLIGTAPRGLTWSPEGKHLAFLWNDEGFNFRDVWVIEANAPGSKPQRLTQMLQAALPADSEEPDSEDPLANAEDPLRSR